MNLFHDNMDRAAQNFLKEIFGKDYEYDVTDGDNNESGQTFIYIAIAEMPFKYANAR